MCFLIFTLNACVTGSRADVGSRMDNGAPPSRMSSRLSQVSTQARLEIDEVSLVANMTAFVHHHTRWFEVFINLINGLIFA